LWENKWRMCRIGFGSTSGMGNCGRSVNESLLLDRPGLIGTAILDAGQEEGKGKGRRGNEEGECRRERWERRMGWGEERGGGSDPVCGQ
jgi:hypothetical protein